jgi:hypothetical protein
MATEKSTAHTMATATPVPIILVISGQRMVTPYPRNRGIGPDLLSCDAHLGEGWRSGPCSPGGSNATIRKTCAKRRLIASRGSEVEGCCSGREPRPQSIPMDPNALAEPRRSSPQHHAHGRFRPQMAGNVAAVSPADICPVVLRTRHIKRKPRLLRPGLGDGHLEDGGALG